MLKILLCIQAGRTPFKLEEYDKAIVHPTEVLPIEERLLGPWYIILLHAKFILACCFANTNQLERALQVSNEILQNGFEFRGPRGASNHCESMDMSSEIVIQQQTGHMAQLRKWL
jgi:hypothetical protein